MKTINYWLTDGLSANDITFLLYRNGRTLYSLYATVNVRLFGKGGFYYLFNAWNTLFVPSAVYSIKSENRHFILASPEHVAFVGCTN